MQQPVPEIKHGLDALLQDTRDFFRSRGLKLAPTWVAEREIVEYQDYFPIAHLLAAYTEDQLLKVPGVGHRILATIKNTLSQEGLSLGMYTPRQVGLDKPRGPASEKQKNEIMLAIIAVYSTENPDANLASETLDVQTLTL